MIIIHCPESPKTMYNIQCIFLSIKLIGYVIRSSLKNYSSSVVGGSWSKWHPLCFLLIRKTQQVVMQWPLFSFPTVATWTLSTLIPKIHFGNQINSNEFNASFIGYWKKSTKDNSAYWHRKVLYTSPRPETSNPNYIAPRCYIYPRWHF